MGYNLKKHTILLGDEGRIFWKRKNILRFMYPLMILFGFVMIMSVVAPAFALPTTKASALTLKEMREDYTLSRSYDDRSQSPKTTLSAPVDPCLSSLQARLSPDAKAKDLNNQSTHQRLADKKAVPVALGFMLGYRIARGPHEAITTGENVQIGSNSRRNLKGGNSRALAVAAYRSCKNELTLKQAYRSSRPFLKFEY